MTRSTPINGAAMWICVDDEEKSIGAVDAGKRVGAYSMNSAIFPLVAERR